jgi:hypothetical protein
VPEIVNAAWENEVADGPAATIQPALERHARVGHQLKLHRYSCLLLNNRGSVLDR